MKYMLLMYCDESLWTEEELKQAREESREICHELARKGQYIDASPLQDVATATSVRVRDGKAHVIDGPFAETKEQLGGYVLVNVETREEAEAIAARFPGVRKGTAEIRPLFHLEGLPSATPSP